VAAATAIPRLVFHGFLADLISSARGKSSHSSARLRTPPNLRPGGQKPWKTSNIGSELPAGRSGTHDELAGSELRQVSRKRVTASASSRRKASGFKSEAPPLSREIFRVGLGRFVAVRTESFRASPLLADAKIYHQSATLGNVRRCVQSQSERPPRPPTGDGD